MATDMHKKYIEMNNQLIIAISGLSGCGKRELANYFSRDFNFDVISTNSFIKPDYNEKYTLPNGTEYENITDNVDAIDWVKFNKTVNDRKDGGIIITSYVFTPELMDYKIDIGFHLKCSKDKLLENRHKFIYENNDKEPYKKMYELMNSKMDKYILNQITLPKYYTYKNIIGTYINTDNIKIEEVYDKAFDIVVKAINDDLIKVKGLRGYISYD